MLEASIADRAIAYLLEVQKDDGSWDESPDVAQYNLPPWINPGDLRTRLYLTAYAAYWLALRGNRAHPAFQRALNFLLLHQEKGGKFTGHLHTSWITTSVFLMAGERYARVAEQGLDYLFNIPLDKWADSQVSWALDCLGHAGLKKEHHFIMKGIQVK